MSVHATHLREGLSDNELDAELHDDLSLDSLFEAEELWAPERVRFLHSCLKAGVQANELPQSLKWNWSVKAFTLAGLGFGPLSSYRLMGLKCQEQWQGLLLSSAVGHLSRLEPRGRELVYVEFVETAPWNWKLDKAGRASRFKAVGRQLLTLAVTLSKSYGFGGRIALHSLPQAEGFYRDALKMTDLGPDAKYQGLSYFEFSESQAKQHLGEI
jgi:hypothetical protein